MLLTMATTFTLTLCTKSEKTEFGVVSAVEDSQSSATSDSELRATAERYKKGTRVNHIPFNLMFIQVNVYTYLTGELRKIP